MALPSMQLQAADPHRFGDPQPACCLLLPWLSSKSLTCLPQSTHILQSSTRIYSQYGSLNALCPFLIVSCPSPSILQFYLHSSRRRQEVSTIRRGILFVLYTVHSLFLPKCVHDYISNKITLV